MQLGSISDRTRYALRKCSHSFRSISDLFRSISDRGRPGSLWESIHTRLDRSQTCLDRTRFSLRKCSHSFRSISDSFRSISDLFRSISDLFRSISDRTRFSLRKCSHSFRSISDSFKSQFAFARSHSDCFWLWSISDRSNSQASVNGFDQRISELWWHRMWHVMHPYYMWNPEVILPQTQTQSCCCQITISLQS